MVAFGLQEIRKGTHTHREYKVRFAVPKDWTLKKGESDSILCEGVDPKEQLRAWLFTMKAAGDTLEADAQLMKLVLKEVEKETPIDCRWCGELLMDHKKPKIEEGTLKIGAREIKTKTVTEYDCRGAERERGVHSTEVPGWFVQGRSAKVISFEVKK